MNTQTALRTWLFHVASCCQKLLPSLNTPTVESHPDNSASDLSMGGRGLSCQQKMTEHRSTIVRAKMSQYMIHPAMSTVHWNPCRDACHLQKVQAALRPTVLMHERHYTDVDLATIDRYNRPTIDCRQQLRLSYPAGLTPDPSSSTH